MIRSVSLRSARGHRLAEHTADVFVEAWAPDLAGCCEEAVAGLVSVYASEPVTADLSPSVVEVEAGSGEQLLLAVLDEVIFLLDTADGVPVGAVVRPGAGPAGSFEVEIAMASPWRVAATGSVPKAVARSVSVVENPEGGEGGVRCRVLVDV